MGKYYVHDLETTVRNKGDKAVGKFAANPFFKDNTTVCHAVKPEGGDAYTGDLWNVFSPQPDMDLLVGQNLGFDMHYLLGYPDWMKWFRSPKSKIWDTQIAEYILTGQEVKYADLNYLSEKYGGTQKNDKIKQYWDAGYETEEIPYSELKEYAEYDVINTEIVFLAQIELAHQQGQLDLIMAMMESRMATIDMEHNGLFFDRQAAWIRRNTINRELETMWYDTSATMNTLAPAGVAIDPSSSLQLSKFLLGGTHKYKMRCDILDSDGNPVYYKSGAKKGLPKTRIEVKEYNLLPRLGFQPPSTEALAKGGWKLDDKVLKEIIGQLEIDGSDPSCLEMLKKVRKAREVQKDLTAFYNPFINLTWEDGCIHANFSHTASDTGRLSCSSPNIQQVSGSDD